MLKNQPEDFMSKESRGILYHCRMRYLKSRDGSERIQKPALFEKAQGPCPSSRLLPPTELMTREHSLRHSYWKTHNLPTLPKAEFLKKREDPEVKKKREAIYAKMRMAELSSERYNRERETRKRLEAEVSDSAEDESSSIVSLSLVTQKGTNSLIDEIKNDSTLVLMSSQRKSHR